MLQRVRDWLIDPRVKSLDPNSAQFTLAHRQVLQDKAMVRHLFEGFYRSCRQLDNQHFKDCPGYRLELGSGSSFIKQIYPDIIASDIKHLPFTDTILDAQAIPFPNNSLRAIYAINVFHHLPQPRLFFKEALRVLHPGGGVIMIEPYYGPLASKLFKNLHASEGFDREMPTWETVDYAGPAVGANQALSYIVFKRDVTQFQREFSRLELIADHPHTHLLYFVSGGVNFRQLLPNFCIPLITLTQRLLAPLNPWLAIQHTLVLRKRG